ncbi:MAG: CinA family protein, partial [Clostridia bacterium]|nr:CinA family protein [Clostridia bacterium]
AVREETRRESCSTTVGVAISGIAGPTGGTDEKPVGTVCFGFCIDGSTVTATRRLKNRGRQAVRTAAVDFVFETLDSLL